MARIRSIKPEFWDSPGTAQASLRARLFYIAMWNWADDWGIGDANPKRLLGFAFPSDESSDAEPRNFRRLAEEVAECYGVVWYEVAGRDYYAIPSWEEHQRTEKKARRANPDQYQAERILYEPVSENPPRGGGKGQDGKGSRGSGNRGTGEEGFLSAVADATHGRATRPEIDALLDHLDQGIAANDAKLPARNKRNTDAMRLLLDRDNRTPDQVRAAIDFATTDEFWRANILSASKLREKYDQLRMSAERAGWRRPGGRRQTERIEFWEAEQAANRAYDQAQAAKEIQP